MLDKILGTKTAELMMLHLFHYGEVYPRGLARDTQISLSAIQNQLQRFEEAGVIISKKIGNVRVYRFNAKSPLTQPLMALVRVVHASMSLSDKALLFKERNRPRRAGKPVIKRVDHD